MNGDALTIVTTSLNAQSNALLAQAAALEKDAAGLTSKIATMLASAQDARSTAAQLAIAITAISNPTQAQIIPGE